LTQRHTYGDLTAWFDTAQTPAPLIRIGLAHGSVQGILAEDIDSANPIALDRPELARLDYLALGMAPRSSTPAWPTAARRSPTVSRRTRPAMPYWWIFRHRALPRP
jgi:hypothetical protein